MQKNKFVIPEAVSSYKSYDGLEIPAFFYRPEKSNGAAILYPHGGPKDQYGFAGNDIAYILSQRDIPILLRTIALSHRIRKRFWTHELQWLGCGRYTRLPVWRKIFTNSEKYKTWSHCDHRRQLWWIYDRQRAFAPPWFICMWHCKIRRFKFSQFVGVCEKRLRLYTEIFLGHPTDNLQTYLKERITEAKNIQKPVLILHGLLDTIVPPEASEEWVEALRREGKIFEYKTYDDYDSWFSAAWKSFWCLWTYGEVFGLVFAPKCICPAPIKCIVFCNYKDKSNT